MPAPRVRVQNISGAGRGEVVARLGKLHVLLVSQGDSKTRLHSAIVLHLAPRRRTILQQLYQTMSPGAGRGPGPTLQEHNQSGTRAPLDHCQKHHHLGHHHVFLHGHTPLRMLGMRVPSTGKPSCSGEDRHASHHRSPPLHSPCSCRDRQALKPVECTLARGPLSLTSAKPQRQQGPVKPVNVHRSHVSATKGPLPSQTLSNQHRLCVTLVIRAQSWQLCSMGSH